MPTLPTYDSQERVQTQAPQMRAVASGEEAKKIINTGDQLQAVAAEWQKVNDIMDYKRGKNEMIIALSEAKTLAVEEGDPDKGYVYEEMGVKGKSAAMQYIKNPHVAQQASAEFDAMIDINNIEIGSLFRQKKIVQDIDITDTSLKNLKRKYIDSETNEQRLDILSQAAGEIQVAGQMKTYGSEKYNKAVDDLNEWEYQRALADARRRPDETILAVKNGEYKLTRDQQYEFAKEAIKIKKDWADARKLLGDINEAKGALKAAKMMATNTLTPLEISDMVDDAEMTDELGADFLAALNPDLEPPSDTDIADAYLGVLGELKSNDVKSAFKLIERVVKARAKGMFPEDQMAYFLQKADAKIEMMGKPKQYNEDWDKFMYALTGMERYLEFSVQQLSQGQTFEKALLETQKEMLIDQDPTLMTAEDPIGAAYRKYAIKGLKSIGFPTSEANIKTWIDLMEAGDEPVQEGARVVGFSPKVPDMMTGDRGGDTQLSMRVVINGKEMSIPKLVPGMTKEEIEKLARGEEPTEAMVKKSVAYAKKNIASGKDVWKGNWTTSGKYGYREDGTVKGKGFLGEIKNDDGTISTELSIDVEIDGKEILIPLLVPTLTKAEIDHLKSGKKFTDAMVKKAVAHAKKRIAAGKSPFK